MSGNKKFCKKLTKEEIIQELNKVEGFFNQVPEGLKAEAVGMFIIELTIWGSHNYLEGLGILEETLFRYRELSLPVLEAEEEDNEETERCD